MTKREFMQAYVLADLAHDVRSAPIGRAEIAWVQIEKACNESMSAIELKRQRKADQLSA